MFEPQDLSRRVFLTRLGGLTISLGTMGWWLPRMAMGKNPYQDGAWLAGDHHIHTKYSPDGQYEVAEQVKRARQHGLSWCVITDHGGPRHDKIAVKKVYPELIAAREKYPGIQVFQGLEWNVPEAEHGSVIVPPTRNEAKVVAAFETRFDSKNFSRKGTPANTEADAVAAVKYLQRLKHKPLFFVNHPARTGRVSPAEIRAWSDAGPDVARGFEGAPGHQAATLAGSARGHYYKAPSPGSCPHLPHHSYRTWSGYDWYVAQVGGVWDSLLGEGRPWFITANSDSHRHHADRTLVNPLPYLFTGHVTATTHHSHDQSDNIDFWPGEYTKTWVYAQSRAPLAILDGLRSGSMFTSHGDIVDRLEMTAASADAMAPMGGTLRLEKGGQDVELQVRLRVPERENFGGRRAAVHHVDVIAGDILGPAKDRDVLTNTTTKVVAQVPAAQMERSGPWLTMRHKFERVTRDFYIRLRGTNRDVDAPQMDTLAVNPWDDLWFYSNPIMVRVGRPG